MGAKFFRPEKLNTAYAYQFAANPTLPEQLHYLQAKFMMEGQVNFLVDKTWKKYKETPASKRLLIAISGIPGSGKTTLAKIVTQRLNALHDEEAPGLACIPVTAFIPMDGYHFTRAQLSAMPDPATAHARRGAAFTFDGEAFLALVKKIREPLCPESVTLHAPSFDHATKDPVVDDIAIGPSARILVFEGNYLSLNEKPWNQIAELMDELWFVKVDFETARQRLVERHIRTGVAETPEEALKRANENDLVNGEQIVKGRLNVTEELVSKDDDAWAPGGMKAAS